MGEPERSNHIISPNGPSSLSPAGWPGMSDRPPFLCGLKGCDTQLGHQITSLPARHISPYASTQPMEDFAENFMHFVKHRGVLPAQWRTRDIEKRWEFVRGLILN